MLFSNTYTIYDNDMAWLFILDLLDYSYVIVVHICDFDKSSSWSGKITP